MTAHTVPAIVPIVAVKSDTEDATSHIAAATTHMNPFEPTATVHEKMAKPFFERVFAPLDDPHRLLKYFPNGVRYFFEPPVVSRKLRKGVSEPG